MRVVTDDADSEHGFAGYDGSKVVACEPGADRGEVLGTGAGVGAYDDIGVGPIDVQTRRDAVLLEDGDDERRVVGRKRRAMEPLTGLQVEPDRSVEKNGRGCQAFPSQPLGGTAGAPARGDKDRSAAPAKFVQRVKRPLVDARVGVPQGAVEVGDDEVDAADQAPTSAD